MKFLRILFFVLVFMTPLLGHSQSVIDTGSNCDLNLDGQCNEEEQDLLSQQLSGYFSSMRKYNVLAIAIGLIIVIPVFLYRLVSLFARKDLNIKDSEMDNHMHFTMIFIIVSVILLFYYVNRIIKYG